MTNFEKLQRLLEELFQLDQADLDFGIYRIMNQKRDEVVRFLEKDLLPQVKEAFGHYKSADKATLQKELDKAIEQAKGLGVDPETTTKVKELREQMADTSVDVTALENEVFSHLFNFFRRYYHEGDFISLRRYKEGVYAIPYEGEEVKLHWANHDQYYVKSSETFRDYTFKLPTGTKVHFKLIDASAEQDNKKESAGKERRFRYIGLGSEATDAHGSTRIPEGDSPGDPPADLFLEFSYLASDSKSKQKELNQEAAERIVSDIRANPCRSVADHLAALAPTKANPKRTVLEKHLTQYTARNTFDYFIHKDLGGFLRRELDFFVKNEVLHLDDIAHIGSKIDLSSGVRYISLLSKVQVIRDIAYKVIQFLEQLENFQKKLWLKKKFVVEANYCITLDRVPEELYPEITANDAQREEWVRLFAIDEIEKDLTGPGYSKPLTVEFLKSSQSLVLDTCHFDCAFRSRLLGAIERVDESLNGWIFNADNFQAISLMRPAMTDQVKCVYIDPPYNTGKDEFIYKDAYQHSCWLSMLSVHTQITAPLLTHDAVFMQSIGDDELPRLLFLMESAFGEDNHLSTFVWNTDGNIDNQSKIKQNHEYVVAFSPNERSVQHPSVVDPNIDQDSKLFNDRIENTIVKNGPGNPVSEIVLPVGFPADFKEGEIVPGKANWPKFEKSARVADGKLAEELCIRSGWSSKKLIEAFIKCGLQPITDSKGLNTTFCVKDTGAPYVIKERGDRQSHVLSVLRKMGSTQSMSGQLKKMGFEFDYPKPLQLISYLLSVFSDDNSVIMDSFAGSGTAGHAVLTLNQADDGNRRFMLMEMGEHFDNLLLPRMKKCVYSDDWEGGKPKSRSKRSHLFKYIRLESYEDALNNLEMKRTSQQTSLLEQDDDLREQYVLSYMLDVESRGSQSLLNVESFRNPDQYKLRVERNGETQLVNVDLVETFNWLLGLIVKHIDVRVSEKLGGVRVVEGTNPNGDRVLVLWRNLDETDNDALDEWFNKQKYNTKDQEYDLIYVNGDNNLENLRRSDQTWKVRLIEEEFGRLMFDVEDV